MELEIYLLKYFILVFMYKSMSLEMWEKFVINLNVMFKEFL